MPSKIEIAKNKFSFWLDNYLQPLLDDKDKIKSWLELLSEWIVQNKDLFKYPLIQLYEFLEDDFSPTIRLIEKQISEWTLSKRKYKILLQDTFPKNLPNIFLKFKGYFENVSKNYFAQIHFYNKTNSETRFAYKKTFEDFIFLEDLVLSIEDIIKYWVNKEDNEYYYFEWYDWENNEKLIKLWNTKKTSIDKRTLKKDIEVWHLEYKINTENFSLELYLRGEKWMYQNIPFSDLGLTYKHWGINVRGAMFNNLLEQKKIITNDKNRQHISKINNSFKNILQLNDKVIQSSDWEYTFKISKKIELFKEKTPSDVLWYPARYKTFSDEFDTKVNDPFKSDSEHLWLWENENNVVSLDEIDEDKLPHIDNRYQ